MTKPKNRVTEEVGKLSKDAQVVPGRYSTIDALARELHASYNQVVGGYMRQPIYLIHLPSGVFVYGGCVLSGEAYVCKKEVPDTEEFSYCWHCPVYYRVVEPKKEKKVE